MTPTTTAAHGAETPRTDAATAEPADFRGNVHGYVGLYCTAANFARKLERELNAAQAELAAARAELRALREDRDRLDWLERNALIPTESSPFTGNAHVTRAAIDSAREATREAQRSQRGTAT